MRLFPRPASGPGPCLVCGATNSTCTGDHDSPFTHPEIIDQRFGRHWRFRSLREVRRRLPDGRFEVVWPKGMPVPPEEALRQKIVAWEDLTEREQQRVLAFLERNQKQIKGDIVSIGAKG